MTTMQVTATYTPQKISRMQGNPLIEALPPEMSDESLAQALFLEPDFSEDQCGWENHHRIQQIKGLGNFMVPLGRHLELARMLDAMMREGYVGRAPKTKEMVQTLQQIYEMQKSGKTFSQIVSSVSTPDTAALIGPSGLGKTTTVRRHLSRYPQVIYHEDLNINQVTYLHIDISSDGASVKALAIAIITALDKLLPDHDYHKLYLRSTSRNSTEALIHTVSRLLTIHHVGLLIADEVQNLCNSKKGSQIVMTELVTMCNMLNVPILFIGTNKASQILTADFRQARRATGIGIKPWSAMPRYDVPIDELPLDLESRLEASEWAQFVEVLWEYQWTRKPVPLTEQMLDTLYKRTQGILDLAIKLFATAQVRAILTGTEIISVSLIEQVYEEDFKLLHEAIEALARNDYASLARYADVAPTNLDEILTGLLHKSSRSRLKTRFSKPTEPHFQTQIAAAAMASGVDEEQAIALAHEIANEGKVKDSAEGLQELTRKLRPAPLRTPAAGSGGKPIEWPDFSERPGDYRRALKIAHETGTHVAPHMESLGFIQEAQELIGI